MPGAPLREFSFTMIKFKGIQHASSRKLFEQIYEYFIFFFFSFCFAVVDVEIHLNVELLHIDKRKVDML